jgi:hypothetical protein
MVSLCHCLLAHCCVGSTVWLVLDSGQTTDPSEIQKRKCALKNLFFHFLLTNVISLFSFLIFSSHRTMSQVMEQPPQYYYAVNS